VLRNDLDKKLGATYAQELIEALEVSLRHFEEVGELPEIVQVSIRSRSSSGEWKMTTSDFKILASDRRLKAAHDFTIERSTEPGRSYRFLYRNGQLHVAPKDLAR
jgi:hypothetical protein